MCDHDDVILRRVARMGVSAMGMAVRVVRLVGMVRTVMMVMVCRR